MDAVPLDADTPGHLLRSWHALRAATDRELEPYVPPTPFDEALAGALSDDLMARRGWLLVDASSVVAATVLELPLLDNPQLAMLDVRVDESRRRAGLGKTLIGMAARAASDDGRRSLLVEAPDDSPGAATLAALGAKPALGSTASLLRLADLDRPLVDRWIARRSERASDYSVTRWIDRCPDDLVEATAKLREAMNTAPLGELDLVIEWSPERIRADERAALRRGWRSYVVVARHDPTGELAGLTCVNLPLGRPSAAYQEDTVVQPEHRNRGLGRWVKAEMLRWLAGEEPRLEAILTWNATENAAMRHINTELGFKPVATWNEWQFDVASLCRGPRVATPARAARR